MLLGDAALLSGRYDAALLHVDESTLGAWRMALAASAHRLPTALLIYAVDLKAQAIRDLLALGAVDFMRPPFCAEELRARIERVLNRSASIQVAERPSDYGRASSHGFARAKGGAAGAPPTGLARDLEAELCSTILNRSGTELEAYAVALATQRATSRASFRAAKGEIVARFERAYIHAALGRHGGNITMAARMAQKHRRAFWALMRKHDIDPAPYRMDPAHAGPYTGEDG
jgi:DNA-binding NtrC family response regulator